MFENLTPRERKLVYATMGLVPLALIFVGVFSFINKVNTNNDRSMALITNIDTETERLHAALKANRRRVYYNSVSMPPNLNAASNEYGVWVKRLLSDLDMEIGGFQPRDAGVLKHEKKVLGKKKMFTVTTKGNLNQLTEFLSRFYSVDLLHRINSLKITPQNEIVGNNKKIRSGILSLSITIEVLALNEADERSEFTKQYRELAREAEEYQNKIVHRNIFGPANNSPVLSARPSSSYLEEREIKISVSAKDADETDLLSFELLETGGIEGDAQLVHAKPEDRRAQLVIPAQKPGEYTAKMKVVDNGFPPKEMIIDVPFKVREKPEPPPVAKKDPPPPPPPPYKNAKQAIVGSMLRGADGLWEVWIDVRLTGKLHKVKEGESFDVDERTWTIKSIASDKIVINVDDKLLTYFEGDVLSEPRSEEASDPASTNVKKSDLPPVPTDATG